MDLHSNTAAARDDDDDDDSDIVKFAELLTESKRKTCSSENTLYDALPKVIHT